MARLPIPCYNIKQFTWSGVNGCQEVSTLEHSEWLRTMCDRPWDAVWDDACDVGFEVQEKHERVLFLLSRIERNADGDVTCWVFKSHDCRGMDGRFTITVYNDWGVSR